MNTEVRNPLVLFMPSGKRGRFAVGTPILDAARSLGVYVESVCGGRGICGRCQIEVQEGNFAKHKIVSSNDHISGTGPKEERYERVRGLPDGRRLSCSALILGDLVIDVPQDTVINAQVVRKAASDRVIERNSAVQLCYVEVDEPDMHKPLGDLDRLKAMLEKDWGWKDAGRPHVTRRCSPCCAGQLGRHCGDSRDMDPRAFHHRPVAGSRTSLRHCRDIGSTTTMHLVSLLSGASQPHRALKPADPLARIVSRVLDDEPGRPQA